MDVGGWAAPGPARLDDDDIERYSRQLLLPEFGEPEQIHLGRSRVAIIGCGGLGGPAALHLAGAGVGRILLIDPDRVGLDNLHRQVAFRTPDIGRLKVDALRDALVTLNPKVTVVARPRQLLPASFDRVLLGHDLVLECSDQPSLKFAVNDWCVSRGVPLVVGGAVGWTGQVTSVVPSGPCFRCLFRGPAVEQDQSCRTAGVMGPLVGMVGALQALEGIRLLTGTRPQGGRFMDFDGRSGRWRSLSMTSDQACSAHQAGAVVRP
ncbi:MAG: HesA/MoeB/ThiF family protein [Candidatus Dormibacteria bacterium]